MKRMGKRVRRMISRRAVAVKVHPLRTAGANDAKWFPKATALEAGRGHAERLLTAILTGYPEYYMICYGDTPPTCH